MARCNDCNRLTSDESTEPEVLDENWGAEAATCTVRIARACEECGTEKKEAMLDLTADYTDEMLAHDCGKGENFEVEGTVDVENTERVTKPGRYGKRLYGVEATFHFTCAHCKKELDSITITDEVQASGMEEL